MKLDHNYMSRSGQRVFPHGPYVFNYFLLRLDRFAAVQVDHIPDAAVRRVVQLIVGQAPAPLAFAEAGPVHAATVRQVENVLHQHHRRVGDGRKRQAHEVPRHAGAVAAEVAAGAIAFLIEAVPVHVIVVRPGGFVPAPGGVVVVGGDVTDCVRLVIMRQIRFGAGREGEVEHLHAGEAIVGPEGVDLRGDDAEVFREDGQVVAEFLLEHVENRLSGAFDPAALDGGGFAFVHGPVGLEAAEMIDPEHVDHRQGGADPAHPPAEIVGADGFPVVEGIAPELPGGGEIIRRNAGLEIGLAVVVEEEELRFRPDVGGVVGAVDRHVAEEFNVAVREVPLQRRQLAEKDELAEFVIPHFVGEKAAEFLDAFRRVATEFAVGPLVPRLAFVEILRGHEEGEVVYPAFVDLAEQFKLASEVGVTPGVEEAVLRFPEGAFLEGGGGRVVGVHGVAGCAVQIAPVEEFEVDQVVEGNEERVPGVAGHGLVRAVGAAGWPERQHLPDADAGLVEKIGEVAGGLAEVADAVAAGEGGRMENDAGKSGEGHGDLL